MWHLRRRAALALVVAGLSKAAFARGDTPIIAGAADLKFALEDIAQAFEAQGYGRVRLIFGSSGNIARQIEQGAPYQMFLSADEGFVFRLADRGLTRDRGALYAVGRIVIFIPSWSDLQADGSFANLREAIANRRLSRFAIANPEHAPYGVAAMQALQSQGLWEAIRPALVFGENVSQAAQFATTGNSQGGIIAYSYALSPHMKERGRFDLIPEAWHEPLRQRMVLVRNPHPVAERFFQFMMERPAREIMVRYGFVLPGE